MNLSGKCLCGAVSYECTVEPVMAGNCHCNDCKKSSGSAYAPTLFFPKNGISITGDPRFFESKGGSGKRVSRGFCPNCGSQIFGKPELAPDLIAIRAGTLDEPSQYKPQMDLYTRHAVAWDVMDESLAKFSEMPPQK